MYKLGLVDGSPTQEIKPLLVDNQGRLMVASIAGAVVVGSITNPVTVGTLPSIPAGNNRVGSVGIEGYFGGGWRKAPIPFGVSAQFFEQYSGTGTTTDGVVVPSNTIRVITNLSYNFGTSLVQLYMYVNLGGNYHRLFHLRASTALQTYFWQGWVVLFPGDRVRWASSSSGTYLVAACGFEYPTNL